MSLSISLLRYFVKKALPTTEETGIGEKPTAEANKYVAEVLEQQQSIRNCSQATAHSEEARAKIGKYASINGTASARRHFKKELGAQYASTRSLTCVSLQLLLILCMSYKYPVI